MLELEKKNTLMEKLSPVIMDAVFPYHKGSVHFSEIYSHYNMLPLKISFESMVNMLGDSFPTLGKCARHLLGRFPNLLKVCLTPLEIPSQSFESMSCSLGDSFPTLGKYTQHLLGRFQNLLKVYLTPFGTVSQACAADCEIKIPLFEKKKSYTYINFISHED